MPSLGLYISRELASLMTLTQMGIGSSVTALSMLAWQHMSLIGSHLGKILSSRVQRENKECPLVRYCHVPSQKT